MASDRETRLREVLRLTEEWRAQVIAIARRVAGAPDCSAQQALHLAALRGALDRLQVAESVERRIIDSMPVLGSILIEALDSVPITDVDGRDLAAALGRVPDMAEQLTGIEALAGALGATGGVP